MDIKGEQLWIQLHSIAAVEAHGGYTYNATSDAASSVSSKGYTVASNAISRQASYLERVRQSSSTLS